ncbi:MAG TPA: UbiD family decarboxylase [Thermoplasmatales archaeon]|nr:UbiD family decarboxylase [Thermoplasmatales archaeon]
MLFKEFLEKLDERGLLVRIKKSVDLKYEITSILRELKDVPVLFENVKGFDIPVAANLCASRSLLSLGLGIEKDKLLKTLLKGIENPSSPKIIESRDYREIKADLSDLPVPKFYPNDGGRYITAGVAVISDREYGLNASYHRAMVIGKDKMVFRVLPRDFYRYVKRGNRRFAFCIGNPPSVMISSSISVDIDKSELDIANSLSPIGLVDFGGILAPEAEIVMIAEVTQEMHDEGPFLDLTETFDIVREQPVIEVEKIFVRKNPVFHSILPGGEEHKILMGLPREVTIFREVSKVCDVKDVLLTSGGCSWLHGVVSIRKRNTDDGKKAIEAAFKGHKSMKHVFVVDDDIDIHDPHQIEWAMATRFQGDRDMVIKKEKGSSLDPSSDLETRMTTKIGFDLTIPWGRDKKDFQKPDLPMKIDLKEYL